MTPMPGEHYLSTKVLRHTSIHEFLKFFFPTYPYLGFPISIFPIAHGQIIAAISYLVTAMNPTESIEL